MPALMRRVLAALVCTTAAFAGLSVVGEPASAAKSPRAPRQFTATIEGYAAYVGQTSCDPHIKSGTAKLGALLEKTYPSTNWTATYACGTDGSQSEHYEGRAIDWMVSVRNWQRAKARAFHKWLLATDKYGNTAAMARRLGVMYIIFNDSIWGSWDGRWQEYHGCWSKRLSARAYDNSCHRTHMHISLSWNGARGKTTFWARHVSPTDYGPCLRKGKRYAPKWTHVNLAGCPGQ